MEIYSKFIFCVGSNSSLISMWRRKWERSYGDALLDDIHLNNNILEMRCVVEWPISKSVDFPLTHLRKKTMRHQLKPITYNSLLMASISISNQFLCTNTKHLSTEIFLSECKLYPICDVFIIDVSFVIHSFISSYKLRCACSEEEREKEIKKISNKKDVLINFIYYVNESGNHNCVLVCRALIRLKAHANNVSLSLGNE